MPLCAGHSADTSSATGIHDHVAQYGTGKNGICEEEGACTSCGLSQECPQSVGTSGASV